MSAAGEVSREQLCSSGQYRESVVFWVDTLITLCGSSGNHIQAVQMGGAPAATFAFDASTIARAHQLLRQTRHLLQHAPLVALAAVAAPEAPPEARRARPAGWRVIEGQRPA